MPFYAVARLVPAARDAAQRLAPVTLPQMLCAIEAAVDDPPAGVRILEAPQIRRL
jgi:hypothetical protein